MRTQVKTTYQQGKKRERVVAQDPNSGGLKKNFNSHCVPILTPTQKSNDGDYVRHNYITLTFSCVGLVHRQQGKEQKK